jgi:predicted O-linked N-acetylglucosamine transferase (SPINDLY family)
VVTLRGEAFAARVAASLLVTAGFGELVAETHERYAEIVLDFCRDAGRRSALQRRTRELRENSEIFDGTAFARKIEALLEEVAAPAIPGKQPGL